MKPVSPFPMTAYVFSSCLLAQVNPSLETIAAMGAEEPNEVDPENLKDATLLSALPLDFSSNRLNDLKESPYFSAINAMIECGISFDSIKDTNPQLNRFLVNIDESQLEDVTTFEKFTDPYQAPDGLTYDRDTLERSIRAKLTPNVVQSVEDPASTDRSPVQHLG